MDADMIRANDSIADAEKELDRKWSPFNSTSIEVGPQNFNNRPANYN